MDQKHENLLKGLFDYANKLFTYDSTENKQKCMYPGCNKWAIKSHLYSRSAMSFLSRDNKVIVNFRKLYLEESTEVPTAEKVEIKKASRFWAFCNTHDTNLFRSFESQYGKENLLTTSVQLSDYAYRTMIYYLYNHNRQSEVLNLINKKALELGIGNIMNEYSINYETSDFNNGILNIENIKEHLERPNEIKNKMNHFVIHLDSGFLFNNNILFNYRVLNQLLTFLSFFEDNILSDKMLKIFDFKNFFMVHNILSVKEGMYILFTWDANKDYSSLLKDIMCQINSSLSSTFFKENFLSYLFSFNLNYPDKIVYSEKINDIYNYSEKKLFLSYMNSSSYNKQKFYICRNIKRNLMLPGHSNLFKNSKIIKSFIL